MQYPPAPPTKVPDVNVHRVFLSVKLGDIKTTACEERSFFVEFLFGCLFLFVLASVHFFCSEATPIIRRENACVNNFFKDFSG